MQIARRFELKTVLCEEKTWIPKYKGPTGTSPYMWQEDKASVCRESGPVVVTMADAGPTDDTMGTESQPSTPVNEHEEGQVAAQTDNNQANSVDLSLDDRGDGRPRSRERSSNRISAAHHQ